MKSFETSVWVTPQKGGRLFMVLGPDTFVNHFEAQYDSTEDDEEETEDFEIVECGTEPAIMVLLKVRKRSVEKRTRLSLILDDSKVDMEFGQHGTAFKRPALLRILAVGLDLENVNLRTLNIYHDKPETEQWEKVKRKRVIVNMEEGYVKILNA